MEATGLFTVALGLHSPWAVAYVRFTPYGSGDAASRVLRAISDNHANTH